MNDQKGKSTKRHRPTYLYSTLSITIVLYLLGFLGLILIYSERLTNHFKEEITIQIELVDDYKEADKNRLMKILDAESYIKATKFVSKEDAARIMKESEFGEDLELLDYNPLFASIDVQLNAAYANEDSIAKIENELKQYSVVKAFNYPRGLVSSIQSFTQKASAVILIPTLIILLIALTLINNTIRLAMYSSRFIIKSMQLVGATSYFIIKPFMVKGLTSGLISGILAVGGLIATLVYTHDKVPDLGLLGDYNMHFALMGVLILLGLFVSWICTSFAVRKYLNMRLDDLY